VAGLGTMGDIILWRVRGASYGQPYLLCCLWLSPAPRG